jgi:hypothetical protein
MNKSRKTKAKSNPPTLAASRPQFLRPAAIVLVIAVVAAGVFWWSKGRPGDSPPTDVPGAAMNATNQPTSSATINPSYEKLKGRWLRPDGGYIVEIRGVESGGKMDAAYFNPRPINVAKAEASSEGQTVKAFIELRDVNYPGSTYDLAYEAASDQLVGIYYQAALQQRFEVVFERMK